jgi:hypothetical protein
MAEDKIFFAVFEGLILIVSSMKKSENTYSIGT